MLQRLLYLLILTATPAVIDAVQKVLLWLSDGAHLHITVANSNDAVIGGHLCCGSLVRTTAELVIGLLPEWRFRRELDPGTGYAELRISQRD